MSTDWNELTAPGEDVFSAIADAFVATMPAPFAGPAREVGIRIAEFAPAGVLKDLGISDAYNLSGLYQGIPMTHKSFLAQPDAPDLIWLFRRPILNEWAEREEEPLGGLITHVLVHEFAHHFGWSDADIATIDRWWE